MKRSALSVLNSIFDNGFRSVFYDETLVESMGATSPSRRAIGDHVCTIFSEVVARRPPLVVELGTRGGESTRALLAAVRHVGGRLLSVDLEAAPDLRTPDDRWTFVQADDVAFGRDGFESWCRGEALQPTAHVLFVDTSHEYDHTRTELEVWLPFVPPGGVAMFHDTNMRNLYRRLDNTMGQGWDNARGVIRAIEEHLARSYDETCQFVDVTDDWLIRHYPFSSGLTLLIRRHPTDP